MQADVLNQPVSTATYILRGLMAWTLLPAIALANGIVRDSILVPALGAGMGLFMSAVLLMGLVIAYIAIAGPRMGRPPSAVGPLLVGALWVFLNILWEYLFFAGLMGVPANLITQGLDPRSVVQGNIFPLVFIVLAIGPWAFLKYGRG
jgi:hypothetical protein